MGIWLKGKLLEHKWFKDSCITKAHPSMVTAHKNLELTAQFQVAQQVGQCLFQASQVV